MRAAVVLLSLLVAGTAQADCTFTASINGPVASAALSGTVTGTDCIPPAPPPPPPSALKSYSGRLRYVSPTALNYKPDHGDLITINGVNVTIPPAGLPGCTNAELMANTRYYVFAALNGSGAAQCVFRSDGGHKTSETAPNVGTEVRTIAGIEDNTHTLIGMVKTDGSGQFVDQRDRRFVRSWYNETGVTAIAKLGNPANVPSGTAFYELTLNNTAPAGTPVRAYFLSWAGETVQLDISGEFHTDNAPAPSNTHVMAGLACNGVLPLNGSGVAAPIAGGRGKFYTDGNLAANSSFGGVETADDLPEGENYCSMYGNSESGTGWFGGGNPYVTRVRVRTQR